MVPRSRPGATGQSHTGNAADLEDSFTEPDPRHFAQSLLCRCLCLGTASGNDLAGGRPARETSERDAVRRRVPRLHPRSRKLEQVVYEAKKAFEQYDAVDAR